MSSTIRVSAAGKRALETLRKRWEKEEGRKLTQEEVAGRAFETLARQSKEEKAKPWTKKQWAVMERLLSANDPAVSSQDIDEVLYGGEP